VTPARQVIHEIDRLKRLAASVHVVYAPAEATREQVERFVRDEGLSPGEVLIEYWLAPESFVLMTPATGNTVFESTAFQYAVRNWLGYETEMQMRFGPQAGQSVAVRVPGTTERGLIPVGSDCGGDELYLVLRPGPFAPAGHVLHWDHETDQYTTVADSLPALLKASNDLVERDIDLAFFGGDVVERIFQFPDVEELRRQLGAGLSPDHTWQVTGEPRTLLGEALQRKRDDVFAALLDRGADVDDALVAACQASRLELAEAVLRRGANPGVRLGGGQSLLEWAALSRRPRTVALLVRSGARDRLPPAELQRVAGQVRSSAQIDERKRAQILDALGG
jgi:hypothetical protein